MSREKMLEAVKKLETVVWFNENKISFDDYRDNFGLEFKDILEAENRLKRFAPLIKALFPETGDGIIESPILKINNLKKALQEVYNINIPGEMYVKCDSHLKIAGSIKARGGIYEVLKHAETLAMEKGYLEEGEDYSKLASAEFKEFFSKYSIGVGSTGNLGLSIGIISSALGFKVSVHMSRDAKAWKKQLLRERGAVVIEYEQDYSKAVEEGRKLSMRDPMGYYIDDENSKDLFLGYSVAALRLKEQLDREGVIVDQNHKLYVYLPCGVGGAPGGITFGLKNVFKDNVHCFFVEPTHSPCMLLGLLSGKYNEIHVGDYGIDNITEADGLAVGSPSRMVSLMADKLLDAIYTVEDEELFKLLAIAKDTEKIKLEPSACAGLIGPVKINPEEENITHVAWATGGLFLPESIYNNMYSRGKSLL